MVKIRNEEEKDYREVEEAIRKAFWNQYVPGCTEHYLAHRIRAHKDFVPELDFVLEEDGRIIGNIMYTEARLRDEEGKEKKILTFGPVCVVPDLQRKGYGKLLMEHSFQKASELGYDVIVIFGNPGNYVSRGFKSCRKFNISLKDGTCPSAMMAKELIPGALDGRKWTYFQSPAFEFEEAEAEAFDAGFEKWEKGYQASQEEFYIHSHSILE